MQLLQRDLGTIKKRSLPSELSKPGLKVLDDSLGDVVNWLQGVEFGCPREPLDAEFVLAGRLGLPHLQDELNLPEIFAS